jgi:hypothetical protein
LKKALSSINKALRATSTVVTLVTIILVSAILTNTLAYAQLENTIGIKITSHEHGQEIPVGELTIYGTSTDNATSDCIVYADVNDIKPFQKAVATGPGGVNDYSNWTFTYNSSYQLITNGTNELTSKLSCVSSPTNLTKWNSVVIVGVINKNEQQQQQQQPIPTSTTKDNTISDNGTSLDNGTAALAEDNTAPFMFALPSESKLPSTPSETVDTIDYDEGSSEVD